MRNSLLLFIIIVLLSCGKQNKTELASSRIQEIHEIIKVIIRDDSLEVLKNGKDRKMLCEELVRLNIYIPEKPKNGEIPPPPPPWCNCISITDLLNYERGVTLFKAVDSLHLLKQNLNQEKLKVDSNSVDKVNFTTKDKEIQKERAEKPHDFYEMTIPVFSLNGQIAYLELNHYCGRLCGSGKSYYLKKTNGKWKIIKEWSNWES